MSKKTQGRKKIEIKQLENSSNKQVTFSKRRAGIFKKASELTVLCGADVAVIVFSSADKVFCYGHPNINAVLDSYQNGLSSVVKVCDNASDVPVAEFNKKYVEAEKEFEGLKRKTTEMKEMADEKKKIMKEMNVNDGFWWDEVVDLEMMDEREAEQYLRALEEVRQKVAARVHELKILNGTMTGPPVPAVHQLCHMPFMTANNCFGTGQNVQFSCDYHDFET